MGQGQASKLVIRRRLDGSLEVAATDAGRVAGEVVDRIQDAAPQDLAQNQREHGEGQGCAQQQLPGACREELLQTFSRQANLHLAENLGS